jgi:hypothetical protein
MDLQQSGNRLRADSFLNGLFPGMSAGACRFCEKGGFFFAFIFCRGSRFLLPSGNREPEREGKCLRKGGPFFGTDPKNRRGRPREKTADEKCRGFEYNKLGKSFQKKRNSVRP